MLSKHAHYYKTTIRKLHLYKCKKCRYQATVTVGTVMEKTRTDLTKWFLAIYLVAHNKRGVSALLLSQELDVTYKTAWLLLHKIRKAIGEREAQYTLGIVEFDDASSVPLRKAENEAAALRKPPYSSDFR